jgi:hypothetical protein
MATPLFILVAQRFALGTGSVALVAQAFILVASKTYPTKKSTQSESIFYNYASKFFNAFATLTVRFAWC